MDYNKKLTDRQLEILSYIASGLTHSQVSKRLFIGSEAVRKQVAASRKKLNANNTPHLVGLLIASGQLVQDEEDSYKFIAEKPKK